MVSTHRQETCQSLPALQSGTPTAWEEAIYAFLVEKRARSGSTRTVGVLRPNALAVLPGEDPGSGPVRGRSRFRSRHRPLGPGAIVGHGRGPDRLSVLLLSLRHPDGPSHRQPMRRPRTATDRPLGRPGVQRRRGAPPPRGRARHRAWPARPGDPAGPRPHRSAASRGDRPAGVRHLASRARPSSTATGARAASSFVRHVGQATQPEARSCVTVRSGLLRRVPAQIGQRRTR